MPNDIWHKTGDKTPFKGVFDSPVDPDPDTTLNAFPSLGGTPSGRTNRDMNNLRAKRVADAAGAGFTTAQRKGRSFGGAPIDKGT